MSGGLKEFDDLVAAVCDGTITPQQCTRLDALLVASPECRQRYRRYVLLHVRLQQYFVRLPAPALCLDSEQRSEAAIGVPPVTPVHSRVNRWLGGLSVVVAVAVAFALLLLTKNVEQSQAPGESPAMLVHELAFTWAVDGDSLDSLVVNGHQAISVGGSAQLLIRDGRIVSPGRLDPVVLFVSPIVRREGASRGFMIRLPEPRVSEPNPAFAVTATRGGPVEIHVLAGEIETLVQDEHGSSIRSYRLLAGTALQLQRGDRYPRRIELNREQFAQPMPPLAQPKS